MYDYFYDAVGNKRSSENAFKKYSIKLSNALPMDNLDFIILLENHDILPGDSRDKIETQESQVEKAIYYIQQVVRTSTDLYLPKLLQAMEQYYSEYNDNVLQELVFYMKAEMNSKYSKSLIYHSMCIEPYMMIVFLMESFSILKVCINQPVYKIMIMSENTLLCLIICASNS